MGIWNVYVRSEEDNPRDKSENIVTGLPVQPVGMTLGLGRKQLAAMGAVTAFTTAVTAAVKLTRCWVSLTLSDYIAVAVKKPTKDTDLLLDCKSWLGPNRIAFPGADERCRAIL